MPNIAEYTSPVDRLQPEETGPLAWARAGASIRGDYNEAGQQIGKGLRDVGEGVKELGQKVDDHNYFMELSHGLATHAQMMAGIDKQQQDFFKNVDPNDATASQQFYNSAVQPSLTQWQQGFSTKRGQLWAAERVGEATQHFLRQGTAEMSNLSAQAVTTNGMKMEEDMTNMAANNPASLPFVMGQVDANRKALVAASPNLSAEAQAKFLGEDTEKLKTKIETAAFQSLALSNPAAAQKALQAGQFPHVDGTHSVQFLKAAEHNQKVEADMARAAADRADRKRSEAITDQFLGSAAAAEKAGDYSTLQGMATQALGSAKPGGLHPAAAIELHRYFQNMAENIQTGKDAPTNPDVQKGINDRLDNFDPESKDAVTFGELVQQRNAGHLNRQAFNDDVSTLKLLTDNPQARGALKDFGEHAKEFQSLIDKSSMLTSDGWGKYRYGQFYNDAKQDFISGLQAGKSSAALLARDGQDSVFKNAGAYLIKPEEEFQFFGQRFSPTGPSIPPSVRVMLQFKQQEQDRVKKREELDKASGLKLPAPATSLGPAYNTSSP
jgi:hypothetical protein